MLSLSDSELQPPGGVLRHASVRIRRALFFFGLAALVVLGLALRAVLRPTPSPAPPSADLCTALPPADWQRRTLSDFPLEVAFPPGWYLHDAGKALEITPRSQPSWSSRSEGLDTPFGPRFMLLHNLNREMGETALAEVQGQVAAWLAGDLSVQPVQEPVVRNREPEVALAWYAAAGGELVLFGATAPEAGRVVGVSAVVSADHWPALRPVFEGILCGMRRAKELP